MFRCPSSWRSTGRVPSARRSQIYPSLIFGLYNLIKDYIKPVRTSAIEYININDSVGSYLIFKNFIVILSTAIIEHLVRQTSLYLFIFI